MLSGFKVNHKPFVFVVFYCQLRGVFKSRMKKAPFLLLLFGICMAANAQKKNKSKDTPVVADSVNYVKPITKGKGKNNHTVSDSTNYSKSDKKGKSKKEDKRDKKEAKTTQVNYTPEVEVPVADTSKQFTGIIKYMMTSDDPADKDSILIVFGESKIRVTMFQPGYREDQVFETNMIADLKDSSFYELDTRNMTYTTEKLSTRNEGTEFSLTNSKKTAPVMKLSCQEYAGEMTTKDGEVFQAACLLSNQHSYIYAMNYNLMNVHPLVLGYKIVLGFRTRSSDNENTYIIAYKIEPGNTSSYFDLSKYHPK